MNRRVYAYELIYAFLYAHTRMIIRTYLYAHTRIVVRTYAYTYTHIRVYLYAHTRIFIRVYLSGTVPTKKRHQIGFKTWYAFRIPRNKVSLGRKQTQSNFFRNQTTFSHTHTDNTAVAYTVVNNSIFVSLQLSSLRFYITCMYM